MISLGRWPRQVANDYGGQQPLSGYLAALAVFGTSVAVAVTTVYRTGRHLPRLAASDLALTAVATHKLGRLIAKDAVTSPLRAPFVSFRGAAGAGEVNEEVTSRSHIAHMVGEVVTCPFCLSVWVATGLCTGWVFAPSATRLISTGLTSVAAADFLQLA